MRGIETRINKLEKQLPPARWAMLLNVWDSDGTLYHTSGTINPTLTINVHGVEPALDMIINHRSASSSPIEKCEE